MRVLAELRDQVAGFTSAVTPGKWRSKKAGTPSGPDSRSLEHPARRKEVQVKEPSWLPSQRRGSADKLKRGAKESTPRSRMAININSRPGQMCRWLGDILKLEARSWAAVSAEDLELAPQRVDVLLAVVHALKLHHVVPDGRVGAVGTDHEVEGDLDLVFYCGLVPRSPCTSNQAVHRRKSAPTSLWLKWNLTLGIFSRMSSRRLLRPPRSTA